MKPLLITCVLSLQVVLAPAGAQESRPTESLHPAAAKLEEALRRRLGEPLEKLDLDVIMLGEDFFGTRPSRPRFGPRGRTLYFRWKRWNERRVGTWVHDLVRGGIRRLSDEEDPPAEGVFGPHRRQWVRVEGEALVLQDLERDEEEGGRELLRMNPAPRDIVFGADGAAVFFRSGDAIYRADTAGGCTQILVIDRTGSEAPEEEAGKGKTGKEKETLATYHERRERELSRVIREREERRERRGELGRKRKERLPRIPRYHVPKGWSLDGVVLSPSGRHMVSRLSRGASGRRTLIPHYVTADAYTRADPGRPKVGDRTKERALEVVDLETGKAVRVASPDEKRKAWPGRPTWSPDGGVLLVNARSDDDQSAWLLRVDLADGSVHVLHRIDDPAWVRTGLRPLFLGGTTRAVFISEATGFAHLYRVETLTGEVHQLTHGRFEVQNPQPTPDGGTIYALATPTSPHVRDLVAVDAESGEMTVLTADGGGRTFQLSPDGKVVAEVFSKGNRPWELRVRRLDRPEEPAPLTDSPSPAFKSYAGFEDPEIVWVPCSDGVRVPARIYRPARPAPGRPAVLFVHGAGYLQNVHHWWSSYFREYGFHHLLRDEGYLVLDLDYRGSAGYGRDWRCAIRAHMGGRDLDDYVDAARWLVREEGVSADRIGIYGGSYGGFLTLMALFTKPGLFRAGAALRPVTDWAHYNDGYTSNILDDPLENPEAYRRSSPIEFAEGLQDHLLICHGLVDSNVHVQDVFRLQQRLIELRKRKWEVALYPLEGHGFRDPASWADEYRRIKGLFDRVLKRER